MRSPIKWTGAKTKLTDFVLRGKPKFNAYFEPFLGSGAVFLALEPENAFCSDLSPEPIHVMNAIKNEHVDFINLARDLAAELYEKEDEFYYQIRDKFNEEKDTMSAHARAAYFMFLNHASFNGIVRFNSKKNNAWNVPYGKRGRKSTKDKMLFNSEFVSRLETLHEFLNIGEKTFAVSSFDEALKNVKPGDFAYCDPPYLITGDHYCGTWNEEKEVRLASLLKEINEREAYFALSNVYEYEGKINQNLMDLYTGFQYETKQHKYILGPNQKTRKNVQEIVIKNF